MQFGHYFAGPINSRRLFAWISMLLVFSVVGCSEPNAESEENTTATTEAKGGQTEGLPGYYLVVDATIDGEPEIALRGGYLILRADATFAIVRAVKFGTQPTGTWQAKGDGKLILDYSHGSSTAAEMEINGNRLTLSYNDAGSEFVMQYERKELPSEPTE